MVLQGPLERKRKEEGREGRSARRRRPSPSLPRLCSRKAGKKSSPPDSMEIYDDELVGRSVSKESVEF